MLAGYGLAIAATETAAFIIGANIVRSRLGSLVERFYVIDLKCEARDEAIVRTQLLHALNVLKLRLRGLESHTLEGGTQVEVEAVVYSARQEDALVEQLVGELSLSPHVHSTAWTSTAPPE